VERYESRGLALFLAVGSEFWLKDREECQVWTGDSVRPDTQNGPKLAQPSS
jgi:hypothetical protein